MAKESLKRRHAYLLRLLAAVPDGLVAPNDGLAVTALYQLRVMNLVTSERKGIGIFGSVRFTITDTGRDYVASHPDLPALTLTDAQARLVGYLLDPKTHSPHTFSVWDSKRPGNVTTAWGLIINGAVEVVREKMSDQLPRPNDSFVVTDEGKAAYAAHPVGQAQMTARDQTSARNALLEAFEAQYDSTGRDEADEAVARAAYIRDQSDDAEFIDWHETRAAWALEARRIRTTYLDPIENGVVIVPYVAGAIGKLWFKLFLPYGIQINSGTSDGERVWATSIRELERDSKSRDERTQNAEARIIGRWLLVAADLADTLTKAGE